jgi:hypothetical protein
MGPKLRNCNFNERPFRYAFDSSNSRTSRDSFKRVEASLLMRYEVDYGAGRIDSILAAPNVANRNGERTQKTFRRFR